ncbi:MAG TPA: DUF4232 domain-containing protein [Solirubrobacteraceae bacterium]|nr:DUF4232 domain-containing protein [Solirubrobacteraceae bacterium]
MRISFLGLAVAAGLALSACSGGGGGGAGATQAAQSSPASSTTAEATSSSTTATSSTTTASATAQSTTAAAPAGSGGTGAASVGGPAQQCQASSLTLSYLGGQGATGHGLLGFAIHNTGSACSTGGYPGIQFLSQSGSALATTPQHTTDDFFGHLPLRELTVDPGQSVSFRLGVSHGGGSDANCLTAYGLQVIAPNDTATMRVSIPGGASECGPTTVSPVQPGTSAYP